MRVAWVHPTWRDLVIDRLAADAESRRHFLRHCGAHGILLALSTGGGAGGDRRLPLIAADEDWDAVGDRLYALIPELEAGDLVQILGAIGLALSELGDSAAGAEARALARLALACTAEPWEASRNPITLALLEAWLSVSNLLVPPVAPPSLSATWADLLPAHAPAPADRVEVQRFADWLILCELLSGFSPSLLTSLGYDADQASLSLVFLNRVTAEPESRAFDHVVRALDAIAAMHPQLSARAGTLAAWVRQEMTSAAGGEPSPFEEVGSEVFELPGGVDVERVLADL